MGVYLNSKSPYGMFREDYSLTYYVDKTDILSELVPLIELKNNIGESTGENLEKGLKYVAVTRPRRFGKTVMANMIASYFGKGADSHKEFDTLKAARQLLSGKLNDAPSGRLFRADFRTLQMCQSL